MWPLVGRVAAVTLIFGLVAAPVGYFLGERLGWTVLCGGLLLQLLFQLRYFSRLDRWSHRPVVDASLEGEGVWDDLFGRIYRHEKDVQEQIARRDAEIRMLMAAGQALVDGVVLLDAGNIIRYCNAAAESMLGIQASTDRWQPIVNIVRQPEFVAFLARESWPQPLTLRPERQKDRVLAIHVVPYGESNRLVQIKDITQADRLDRTRRDFVANVSHELRTPLTVLAGFLETLREFEVPDDERQRYLGMMAEQSERMQAIVRDLLALSSIESSPPPGNATMDMASLVDRLRRDAEALSAGRHEIVVEQVEAIDLKGAEHELQSALGNLVSNAIRYTPAGGRITLLWQRRDDGAEFAVNDSGIGIEPQHIARLTERFYRVDRGRSRDSGGTGLGLAIVKHALSRHQARLDITSQPGQGSRFAAVFPAARVVRH